jgi:hypothetical protein
MLCEKYCSTLALMGAWGDRVMSEQEQDHMDSGEVPMMQKLLDNPFLLLFLGVAFPAVLYLGWGIMEIVSIPIR